MKQQLIMIGIITILVSIGLSGCTGNNLLPTSEISISELKLYPEKYVNETVKIKGIYAKQNIYNDYPNYYEFIIDNNTDTLFLDFSKITKPAMQQGNYYYFTGKFVWHGKTNYSSFEYWLEVTNVENIS